MRCDDFENRLNEVLDDRRPWSSDGELGAHARSCPACRELATSYDGALRALVATALADAQLVDVCRAGERSVGVSDLTARVLGQLTSSHSSLVRPSLNFLRRYQYQWAMAAGLLLAVGLGWAALLRAPAARAPGEPLAAARQESSRERSPLQEKHLATTNPSKTALAKDTLAEKTIAKRTQPSSATLAVGDSRPSEALPAAQWAHRVADGLKPVTRPTVGALNGFLELWGVDEPRPRS